MRRVYYVTPRRQRLQADMLKTMREARNHIDPDLLQEARDAITRALERQSVQSLEKSIEKSGKVPVDRKKTLATVMKFLELKPDDKALHHTIQEFLAETGNA